MKKYKLGVIITSCNERTERACLDSLKNFSSKNIHLVENIRPSIKAFRKACIISLKNKYDYIYIIDADVIMLDNWFETISHSIKNDNNFFLKTFTINDKYFGNCDKGNKLYNCKYFDELLNKIDLNYNSILKSPKPMGYLSRYINSKNEYINLNKPIGIHGYEQYYIDIYYRFYLLKIRYRNFNLKKINLDLIEDVNEKNIIKNALKHSNNDKLINLFKSIFFKNYAVSDFKHKSNFYSKLDVAEKKPLTLNREDILKENKFI